MIDSAYERVTVIKGARLGYSSLLVAAIAHYIRNDPTSILAVLPTDDDTRNFIVSQIEPTFDASPALRGAIAEIHRGAQGLGNHDTMRHRRFPGGSLRVVSARSPRNLRSHSARVIVIDESDAMAMTEEGSPILLAERRSLSFGNRKIIIGSSPTTTTTSYVAAAYENSDKRVFQCMCPSCSAFSEVLWRDIRWPEGRPEKAEWLCPKCGVLHGDEFKQIMVEKGRWRATAPHVKGHAGFKINCLVAQHPPAAWGNLAREFVAARRPEDLKVFTTTILGEPWSDDDDSGPQPHELQTLAEPINLENIPLETLFLSSGVDIQGDRIEVSTVGYTESDEWLVLNHQVIFGDPMRDEVWRDLAEILAERYNHPLGGTIGRDATCIDASDGNTTNRVLSFCAGHRHLRVIPIKGAAGSRTALTPTASKRSRSLMICGIDPLKTRLFDRLAKRTGIRFSNELPLVYYEQLTAEHSVIRYSRGQPHRVFERYAGRLAETLDCFIYSLAARSAVTIPTPRREAELSNGPLAPPMPTTIRSAYLDNGRNP